MPASPIRLAGHDYRSGAEAEARAKQIRALPVGAVLVPGNEAFDFLRDCLRIHPGWLRSTVAKVIAFHVCANVAGKGHCLEAELVSGKRIRFSTSKAWARHSDQPLQALIRALRAEVRDQIRACRDDAFSGPGPVLCPVSGVKLSPRRCHVDHAPPNTFAAIAAAFIELHRLGPHTRLALSRDDGTVRLVDRALADKWRRYHAIMATLRVVGVKANLTTVRAEAKAMGVAKP